MTTTHLLRVPAMSCDHCRTAIEQHVGAVAGVTKVDVDLDTKVVAVVGGEVDAVVAAIDDAGYDIA